MSWAQHLKNKDIPEGGSKCIALIAPGGDPDAMVHELADGFLDLVLPAESVPEVRGAHGDARETDLLFLGPDENMTPERIVWVAERAAAPWPADGRHLHEFETGRRDQPQGVRGHV